MKIFDSHDVNSYKKKSNIYVTNLFGTIASLIMEYITSIKKNKKQLYTIQCIIGLIACVYIFIG